MRRKGKWKAERSAMDEEGEMGKQETVVCHRIEQRTGRLE